MTLLSPQPVFFSFLFFATPVGVHWRVPLFWKDLLFHWIVWCGLIRCCDENTVFLIQFQRDSPCGPAVRVFDAFGNNFSNSLVQRLKSRPAQLFSHQSTGHAAAANHMFRWSDINATQQTAQQDVTQWVLLLTVTLITIVHNSYTAFPSFVAPTGERGRYMKRRLQGQPSCCQDFKALILL